MSTSYLSSNSPPNAPFADYNFPLTPAATAESRQLDFETEIGSIERAVRYARHTLQQHRNGECRRSLIDAKAAIDSLLAVIPNSPELAHAPVAGPSSETQYGSQKRKGDERGGTLQRIEKALKFNGFEPPTRIRHSSTTDITLTLPNSSLQSMPDEEQSPVHPTFASTTPSTGFPPPLQVSPVTSSFPHFTPTKYRPIVPQQQPQQEPTYYPPPTQPPPTQQQSFSQAIAQMQQPQPQSLQEDVKPNITPPTATSLGSPASSASPAASTTGAIIHSTLSAATLGPNDMPPELRQTIDEIFFSFLDGVCSNLDATDPKGEPIHQTLMAKKMQRLDESPDYRPFRFRIQAFTNGFLETLSNRGYPEDKLPTKKVRHYLWTHPYISRYNEEGKKTKSKGNHIWSVEARKVPHHERNPQGDGTVWTFRKFERRIAGAPPSVAYVGVRWSWTPRVWDPQAPRVGSEVQWSSEGTLDWMRWDGDELTGTPRPDSQSGDVVIVARFMNDGKDIKLEQKITVNVAPMGADVAIGVGVGSPTRQRRPTLESGSGRRVQSESNVQNRRTARRASIAVMPPEQSQSQSQQPLDRVAQVVAATAKRVNIAQRSMPHPSGLRSLAKQEQVLLAAASTDASAGLVAATQDVVFGAAQHLQAEKPPGEGVMVDEVILATQAAVAQAVLISPERATEVDVMRTASALQQGVPAGSFGVSVTLAPNAINELGLPITVGQAVPVPDVVVPVVDPLVMTPVDAQSMLVAGLTMLPVTVADLSPPPQDVTVGGMMMPDASVMMPPPQDVLMQPDYANAVDFQNMQHHSHSQHHISLM
ncbi:hypothetical protein EXIGLDRAFT_747318 [Exidia glandulosa HHB12029]|uniref:Uncharacterized protein n=1 Tax=Exidia glandulosa HHB12029 TaxID=1314781 RepID=A0A165KXU7_EXIGL|nr:hypothetical protein EXIGLDRAFT_747318 [Exidia glandulosa HHB12029]